MQCYKCGNEFTDRDKHEGNFRQSRISGKFMHLKCPGKDFYVDEQIKAQVADFQGRDSTEQDSGNHDASTWIKRKK